MGGGGYFHELTTTRPFRSRLCGGSRFADRDLLAAVTHEERRYHRTTQFLSSPSPLLRPCGSRRARSRAGTASERGYYRSRRSSLPYVLRRNVPGRVGWYGHW